MQVALEEQIGLGWNPPRGGHYIVLEILSILDVGLAAVEVEGNNYLDWDRSLLEQIGRKDSGGVGDLFSYICLDDMM